MFFKKTAKENNQPSVVSKKSKKEQHSSDLIKPQEEQEYEIVEKEILPEAMICPDCGGITLVGLDFCDKCGGELINRDI